MASTGLPCPVCNCQHRYILRTQERTFTWKGVRKTVTRREQHCRHCGHRWWTNELDEDDIDEAIRDQQLASLLPQFDPTLRRPRE